MFNVQVLIRLTSTFQVVHLLLLVVNCGRFSTKNRTRLNH